MDRGLQSRVGDGVMIDMTKTYRYRNGEPARVLCVDRPDPSYPVLSMAKDGTVFCHYESGASCLVASSDIDLIEVLPRKSTWHNGYDNGAIGEGHSSREKADKAAISKHTRIAVYRIERDADGHNPTIAEEAL